MTTDKLATSGRSQLGEYNDLMVASLPKKTGQFFGLPFKVKELLKEHKGVGDLCGRLKIKKF